MSDEYCFTSESVAMGHPDKVCDAISDAVLDALLMESERQKRDVARVRCACEVMVRRDMVILGGEIRADRCVREAVDFENVVRGVVRDVGYDKPRRGFSADDCVVVNALSSQSEDIAAGVDEGGAGDQGMMFGYACDERFSGGEEGGRRDFMPVSLAIAHALMRRQRRVRKELPWLGPDAKAQVTVVYRRVPGEADTPVAVRHVVLSTMHDAEIEGRKVGCHDEGIFEAVRECIVKPVLAEFGRERDDVKIRVNPCGLFVVGGPAGDCGVTGRKIIVDTYGGAAPHGGGAFSGKDPTKVDRSAAYMMRYVAKNIVAAELAKRCWVQVAYAIGQAKPVSLMVRTVGGRDDALTRVVGEVFRLEPREIIETLGLLAANARPVYRSTAAFGHFGWEEFAWERVDKVEALRGAMGE